MFKQSVAGFWESSGKCPRQRAGIGGVGIVGFVVLFAAAASAQENAGPGLEEPGHGWVVLSLRVCIESALAHNRDITKARQKVEQVGGRALMAKSRFFPHLDVLGDYSATSEGEAGGSEESEYSGAARLSQRILEFGRDTPGDAQLREDRRQAVFAYESTVREVLSEVRRSFFSLLLREEQIRTRRALLEDFRQKLERARAKQEQKIVIPLDVLRAELDVLNEELRINSLVKDQYNRERRLLELIGRAMGTDITLVGALSELEMDEEEAVRLALENSFEVTLAEGRVAEQGRAVRKVMWDHFPELKVEAGMASGDNALGVGVSSSDNTWGVDLSLERSFSDNDSPAGAVDSGTDRFARVEFALPVFDGLESTGRLKSEKAKLRELQAELSRQKDVVELQVRGAYQDLLEARETWRIQKRRVEISKRRLEIQERLKEAGRIGELEIEHFREQFFVDQDQFFLDQDNYVRAQEDLRKLVGRFE